MPESDMQLVWLGDQVFELLMDEGAEALDETTADAALIARADAPVDRGNLAAGFHNEPAKRVGDDIVGRFGVDRAVFYAAAVEVRHPTKAGFIRRAGDRAFGKLAERVGGKAKTIKTSRKGAKSTRRIGFD